MPKLMLLDETEIQCMTRGDGVRGYWNEEVHERFKGLAGSDEPMPAYLDGAFVYLDDYRLRREMDSSLTWGLTVIYA